MKRLLNLLLLLMFSMGAMAQQKPVYERTRTSQVLSDYAGWFKQYFQAPSGNAPSMPSFVPDSVKAKGGQFYYRQSDATLVIYDGAGWHYADSAKISGAYKQKADTTAATGYQTVGNFFPKADTRYYTKAQINSDRVPFSGMTSDVNFNSHSGTFISGSNNLSVNSTGIFANFTNGSYWVNKDSIRWFNSMGQTLISMGYGTAAKINTRLPLRIASTSTVTSADPFATTIDGRPVAGNGSMEYGVLNITGTANPNGQSNVSPYALLVDAKVYGTNTYLSSVFRGKIYSPNFVTGGIQVDYDPTGVNPGPYSLDIRNHSGTTIGKIFDDSGNFTWGSGANHGSKFSVTGTMYVSDTVRLASVAAGGSGDVSLVYNLSTGQVRKGGTGADIASSLKAWTYSTSFALTSITRDSNEAIVTGSVVWPDGATGTFTTDTASSDFPGAVDAYHITYVPAVGTTRTITQSLVTRDLAGAVTAQPLLTVTP